MKYHSLIAVVFDEELEVQAEKEKPKTEHGSGGLG